MRVAMTARIKLSASKIDIRLVMRKNPLLRGKTGAREIDFSVGVRMPILT
jgi:hypothetical protein